MNKTATPNDEQLFLESSQWMLNKYLREAGMLRSLLFKVYAKYIRHRAVVLNKQSERLAKKLNKQKSQYVKITKKILNIKN
jgi:hypothetical protein